MSTLPSYPARGRVELTEEAPRARRRLGDDTWGVDFGRVAFGNLRLTLPPEGGARLVVHFGEAEAGDRVERHPPGTVRYARVEVTGEAGATLLVAPPPDARNTRDRPEGFTPPAVPTPPEWGVILPYRWVEIEGWPGELTPAQVARRAAWPVGWDDAAAAFRCAEPMLDRVAELCRYTIKATCFAGVYVDGDRERIPYEADAYLNQLSHFACDPDPGIARATFDWLQRWPTWPSEWGPHLVLMAQADWWQTGDRAWLAARYEGLRGKLLLERVGADGLVHSDEAHRRQGDLVDWPPGERDGFEFGEINTVVNAFHLRALDAMGDLARAVGRVEEAADYTARWLRGRSALWRRCGDETRGRYRDGGDTDHGSAHANLFTLAFGLVPPAHRASVAGWLANRGMVCSVYAAQYLLAGLWEAGAGEAALALMLAPGDRSWRHMVNSGTTLTWEAWDQRYKPNQDWNHAWGAAPANLLPRYVLGVRAAEPGWTRAAIAPQPSGLAWAEGRVPTPRGGIAVQWETGRTFRLELTLPPGLTALVSVPALAEATTVHVNGELVPARRVAGRWQLDTDVTGQVVVEAR